MDAHVWSNTDISSSQLVQVRAKDAICDAIADATGFKPNPPEPRSELGCAELPLFITVYKDNMRVYRDMSGVSLHRRGYREAMHKASLNEAVAAGVLHLGGWAEAVEGGGKPVLADPMCGSGTLLIEGALMATRTAPGRLQPQP